VTGYCTFYTYFTPFTRNAYVGGGAYGIGGGSGGIGVGGGSSGVGNSSDMVHFIRHLY
jgi:hypothetical protein